MATNSELKQPTGIATDSAGNLYVSNAANHRGCKVDPTSSNSGTTRTSTATARPWTEPPPDLRRPHEVLGRGNSMPRAVSSLHPLCINRDSGQNRQKQRVAKVDSGSVPSFEYYGRKGRSC
ncbi:hypothetical protein ACIG5E_36600 [Kitasatospora sp. NPDC053057]|uniref:hypothetical protein n=1 Tax=Kitasatospora sp. NPDC053057 TaxID=3364062 RepID=UPI0037CA2BA9